MNHTAAIVGVVGVLMPWTTIVFAADSKTTDERFLYLPPSWGEHVVFYHSFSRGTEQPEIPLPGGRVVNGQHGDRVAGLTGPGFRPAGGKAALTVQQMHWPLTDPITVSMWWRLDEPMQPETGFHLITLAANGYISNFVRGNGTWCALREPTFVIQSYNFPGISNVNGIGYGDAWVTEKVWHHVAITISEGSRVTVYWDGRPRSEFALKGRLFATEDVVRSIQWGPHWLGHAMTIDELIVLDRALAAEQVADYVTAVQKLAEVGFPFEEPRKRLDTSGGWKKCEGNPVIGGKHGTCFDVSVLHQDEKGGYH